MILSDSEVEERLNSPKNLINILKREASSFEVKPMPNGGRKEGSETVPSKVRELIASFKREKQADVAEAFGVSAPVVSCANRGLISSSRSRFDEELAEVGKEAEKKSLDEAHELALDCLMESMGCLKSKIKDVINPVKLSRIASDMNKIAAGGLDKDRGGITNNTKVVVFAPVMKELKDFDFIDA